VLFHCTNIGPRSCVGDLLSLTTERHSRRQRCESLTKYQPLRTPKQHQNDKSLRPATIASPIDKSLRPATIASSNDKILEARRDSFTKRQILGVATILHHRQIPEACHDSLITRIKTLEARRDSFNQSTLSLPLLEGVLGEAGLSRHLFPIAFR
jgi:hypothetical protein